MYEVGQEVPVASLFFSLKDPGHDPWVWWLSSAPGGWLELEVLLVPAWQVMVLGSNVSNSVFPSRCKSKS